MGRTLLAAALLLLLMLAGSVELYAPSHAEVGEEVEAVALVNGVRAPGEVLVVSPAGEEERHAGGHAKFNLSESGEWRVEYAGVRRVIEVEGAPAPLAETLAYAAFVIAVLVIAYAFAKSRRRLFVEKRYEGGVVSVEVRNGREELAGILVIDSVPEDAELDLPKGARESRGAGGRSVRWSLPILHAGERVVLRYGLRTGEKALPGAEVRASWAREIRATSDGVHT